MARSDVRLIDGYVTLALGFYMKQPLAGPVVNYMWAHIHGTGAAYIVAARNLGAVVRQMRELAYKTLLKRGACARTRAQPVAQWHPRLKTLATELADHLRRRFTGLMARYSLG